MPLIACSNLQHGLERKLTEKKSYCWGKNTFYDQVMINDALLTAKDFTESAKWEQSVVFFRETITCRSIIALMALLELNMCKKACIPVAWA